MEVFFESEIVIRIVIRISRQAALCSPISYPLLLEFDAGASWLERRRLGDAQLAHSFRYPILGSHKMAMHLNVEIDVPAAAQAASASNFLTFKIASRTST